MGNCMNKIQFAIEGLFGIIVLDIEYSLLGKINTCQIRNIC